MHIAHIINALRVGGAEQLILNFAQAIRDPALSSQDIRLTVITLRRDVPEVLEQAKQFGARVVHFYNRKIYAPGRFWDLVRFLRSEDIDLLHTHLTMANILGASAGRVAGIPVVTSLHNTTMTTAEHPVWSPLETLLLRTAVRQVIAVGWQTAEAHQDRLGGKPVLVLPNAVPIPEPLVPKDRRQIRRELVGDPDVPLLISVGRLEEQKGMPDLLQAFADLQRTHPRASLVIAGDGSLRPELENQVLQQGLSGKARFLGLRRDIPELLGAADIFVSASLWEGLPVATLEALAAGLPVVATAVGDVPRVVVQEAGLLFPPRQPAELAGGLRQLLDNPELRAAQSTAARRHAIRHYSAVNWARRLLEIYRGVISGLPLAKAEEGA